MQQKVKVTILTEKIVWSLKYKQTTLLSLSQTIKILITEIIVLFSFNLLLWQREFGSKKFEIRRKAIASLNVWVTLNKIQMVYSEIRCYLQYKLLEWMNVSMNGSLGGKFI